MIGGTWPYPSTKNNIIFLLGPYVNGKKNHNIPLPIEQINWKSEYTITLGYMKNIHPHKTDVY
jgi:hypothetical protein